MPRSSASMPLSLATTCVRDYWAKHVDTINGFSPATIREVGDAVCLRWKGTKHGTGSVRKVGIECDAYIVAFSLFPQVPRPINPATGQAVQMAGTQEAARRLFMRFCDGETQVAKDAELAEIMEEYNNFLAAEGEFCEPDRRARLDTASKTAQFYASPGAVEPPAHDQVRRMIDTLTFSTDPRKFWNTISCCKTKLWHIQARLHSIEPSSVATERANKYLKAVMQPARSSLAGHRVVMATFVYANLRFLNKRAHIDGSMLDFLATDTTGDATFEQVSDKENQHALTYLLNPPDPVLEKDEEGGVVVDAALPRVQRAPSPPTTVVAQLPT